MKSHIDELRMIMKERGIDAWISPSSDAHGSEYVSKHDMCRQYLSGFTGSAGTLLVFKDTAYLWTDGRYFVQAEAELKGSGIELMKMGEEGVPTLLEFLNEHMQGGDTLGFYAPLLSACFGITLEEQMTDKAVALRTDEDITDIVWQDRPKAPQNQMWRLDDSYAGRRCTDKIADVRKKMSITGSDMYITNAPEDTAWLTNLRGSDIECNPLFLSYLIVTRDEVKLYVRTGARTKEIDAYLNECRVSICDYDNWFKDIKGYTGKKIVLDYDMIDYGTYRLICDDNKLSDKQDIIKLIKCIKNDIEAEHMQESHLRDGVYMTRFLYKLKDSVSSGEKLTEIDASDCLDKMRAEDKNYVSLSFPTISAYGSNAAMCHYEAEADSAAVLQNKGLYLVDSGAQYLDGTTDVTRTISLGPTTEEEKLHYTLTVIAMLRLMHAVFLKGSRGVNLDSYARSILWEYGLDFNHGTGHGVGFCNTVHEGPVAVRLRASQKPGYDPIWEPGMVVSDEPGLYIEGSHGIRTENLLMCVPAELSCGAKDEVDYDDAFLGFVNLTWVPLDRESIITDVMDDKDLEYYNQYQEEVYDCISPYLNEKENNWLKHETDKLDRTN